MTPLRKRMLHDMSVRGFAENTVRSYLQSVMGLARHYRRSPERISAREVQEYLLFLHEERGLSWKSCNCVRHGILFLFRITLGLPDPHFYVPGAKTPSRLTEILNHEELVRLFSVTRNLKHRAVLMTAYAAGLRASEIGRLQVTDIDSARMCLRIEQGKGNKDRYVPLSPRLLKQLRQYWRHDRPRLWLFPSHLGRSMSRAGPAYIYQLAKQKAAIRKAGDPYAETLLCHRAAGGRGRASRHSAPPRARLDPFHDAIPASRRREDERHTVSAGSAGVPPLHAGLTGGT